MHLELGPSASVGCAQGSARININWIHWAPWSLQCLVLCSSCAFSARTIWPSHALKLELSNMISSKTPRSPTPTTYGSGMHQQRQWKTIWLLITSRRCLCDFHLFWQLLSCKRTTAVPIRSSSWRFDANLECISKPQHPQHDKKTARLFGVKLCVLVLYRTYFFLTILWTRKMFHDVSMTKLSYLISYHDYEACVLNVQHRQPFFHLSWPIDVNWHQLPNAIAAPFGENSVLWNAWIRCVWSTMTGWWVAVPAQGGGWLVYYIFIWNIVLNIVDDSWIFLMSHESSTCSCRLVQFKWQYILLLSFAAFRCVPDCSFAVFDLQESQTHSTSSRCNWWGCKGVVKWPDSDCECNRVISRQCGRQI